MQTISKNSKRGKNWLIKYSESECESVFDAYAKPSQRKQQADYECQRQCAIEHGLHYRIITAGSFTFTAAWHTSEGVRIKTASYSYIIK